MTDVRAVSRGNGGTAANDHQREADAGAAAMVGGAFWGVVYTLLALVCLLAGLALYVFAFAAVFDDRWWVAAGLSAGGWACWLVARGLVVAADAVDPREPAS